MTSLPLLRGSPSRITDWMERFQVSYVSAVAAAAGCAVLSIDVDDGIDMMLSHRSTAHKKTGAHLLEVQLKSTGKVLAPNATSVGSKMRQDRYEEHISTDPSVDRIVVIMAMPRNQSQWLTASRSHLMLRHCSYWVNLRGHPTSSAAKPRIKASTTRIFDDLALMGIMSRIGQGGTP